MTAASVPHKIRLGTRGSALATTQSGLVARALEEVAAAQGNALEVELVEISTRGDVDPTPLAELGGVGVFAAVLRHALLAGECDLAVHSFKDLPTAPVPGLVIAAVPPREDPRDALCTVGGAESGPRLADLPRGARVGTGSPRRAAQLLAARPDLEVVAIRGNVPTRLARVVGTVGGDGPMGASREPDLDGVVLALSGLRRLGLESYASEVLKAVPQGAGTERVSPAGASGTAAPVMVPAASQGALAVETRADLAETDPVLAGALAALDDPAAHAAARAERALMRRLEAGCAAPVGAIATPVGDGEALRLDAVVAALDGRTLLRRDATASVVEPEDLGIAVAEALLADGAAELVDLHATKEKPVHEAPRKNPAEPDGEPAAAASQEAAAAADATAGEPATASAATGRARAPRDAHALEGVRVLLPRTKPDDRMAAGLEAAGARVDRVDVTRTVPGPAGPRERAAADLAAGEYAWLVLASPRTLENIDVTGVPESTRLAIIGPGTAHVVTKALGRRPDIVAAGSSAALLELDPMRTGPEPGATGAARRILLPGSKLAGPTLVDGLTAAGWEVDVVSAYTMEEVAPEALPGGFAAEWADGAYDVVVLTAGSSTRALLNLAGPVPERTRVVTIGTPTAVAAREAGIDVDVIAKAPTPPGVRSAVIEALAP